MASTVELVQKQAKERFISLTAKDAGTIPGIRRNMIEWSRQLPSGRKDAARRKSEVFLAMLEGDMRRAMWIVQESKEEDAYLAADYMKHMESRIKGMAPQDLVGDYYELAETFKSEKMDGEVLLSIIEMLKNSKDDSYLLSLARSCNVPYSNLRTIANFWADVSPFEASLELRATGLPIDASNWDSWADYWKFNFDGRHPEFGLSVKNYEITYQNDTTKGVNFSSQQRGLHLKAGNCEIWQFQVKNEKLDELLGLLEGAPIVMPLQFGTAEGTVSVTVFDMQTSLNGIYVRKPFYNVLKARGFDLQQDDMEEFMKDFALSRGMCVEDAKSLSGRVSLWSHCEGGTFRILTDERMY